MESITQKVDQVFAEWDHTTTPGCSLAVIKDGQIIYSRGYGIANLDYGIPIRPDTVFHIASISKHFTDLAVTLLLHEGKLSLEDDIHKYIPELQDFGEKITLNHLIHHTSGLRDQWELLVAAGWRMDDVITMPDILELVSRQKELNFKPGDRYVYCNTGYTLLAFIVQRVSGKSLREFCEERMFRPLGMKNTHFHDDHTMVVPNRAVSYNPTGYNTYQIAVLSYANVGATSLFTTVEDMAKWDQEFYDGKVFGKAVIETMHTRGILNSGEVQDYAFGLVIEDYKGLKSVQHSGGDAGYRTHLLRFPEQHFSVVVFSNLGTVSPSILTHQVADIYLADLLKDPLAGEKVIELPLEDLQKYTGDYYDAAAHKLYPIKLQDGKLMMGIRPLMEIELVAADVFRMKDMPLVKIRFSETATGARIALARDGKGAMGTADKIELPTPGKAELEEYCGVYTSPELDNTWRVVLQDDKLAFQRRKYGTQLLKPVVKDSFFWEWLNIYFQRNENGKIESLQLFTDRTTALRFVRQAES